MVQMKRVVELEIDLMNRTAVWRYLDNNKYTKIREITSLPEVICNQELYFHVSMFKNTDQIDIITSWHPIIVYNLADKFIIHNNDK